MSNIFHLIVHFIKSRTMKAIYYSILGFFVLLVIIDFIVMPVFVNSGGTQTVPNVVGMAEADANRMLDSLHLEPRRGEVRSDDSIPEGYVVFQNPSAEQTVKSGRRVYLTISGGELPVIVPSLKGRSIRDAKFSLDRVGLRQGAISYETSVEFPEGTIVGQDIAAGTRIKKSSFISIRVSAGESIDSIIVPSVIGRTLLEARRILKEKGLLVGNINYQVNNDLLPNTVIDQLPQENKIVTVEKTVDLFIAQAPEKSQKINEE